MDIALEGLDLEPGEYMVATYCDSCSRERTGGPVTKAQLEVIKQCTCGATARVLSIKKVS